MPKRSQHDTGVYAEPQQQFPDTTYPVSELLASADRFTEFPAFQRDEVWPQAYAWALIDSMLRGHPVPALEGFMYHTEDGKWMYGITDGQQRLWAILAFARNEYKTWTVAQKRNLEPAAGPPVDPGKFFQELPPRSRQILLDYRIRINRIQEADPKELAARYLRIQNHIPLSSAEKLKAYASATNDLAMLIAEHEFWDDFYAMRGKNRGQVFQSSLFLIGLEMSPSGITDLYSPSVLHALAAGTFDEKVTSDLEGKVLSRIEMMTKLFHGFRFSIKSTVVPMYQSVRFLEQGGYCVREEDLGALTTWITPIHMESHQSTGIPGYIRPLQRITVKADQERFWALHLPRIYTLLRVKSESAKRG